MFKHWKFGHLPAKILRKDIHQTNSKISIGFVEKHPIVNVLLAKILNRFLLHNSVSGRCYLLVDNFSRYYVLVTVSMWITEYWGTPLPTLSWILSRELSCLPAVREAQVSDIWSRQTNKINVNWTEHPPLLSRTLGLARAMCMVPWRVSVTHLDSPQSVYIRASNEGPHEGS